ESMKGGPARWAAPGLAWRSRNGPSRRMAGRSRSTRPAADPRSGSSCRVDRMRRRTMREDSILGVTRLVAFTLALAAIRQRPAAAETPPLEPLTLTGAIETALRNYPAIRERRARAQAAEEGVGLARTAYLPRLDLLWQENRATTNNVFGLLLPQSIIPPISGPVLGTKSFDSVWGSAGGLLFSWEPMDFGFRKATVDLARATANQAAAGVDVT